MASWVDDTLARLADPDSARRYEESLENDRMIEQRHLKTLARTDLTPLQRQTAERNYAQFLGSLQTYQGSPGTGALDTFTTEYAATAQRVAAGTAGLITDAISWKVWLFAAFTVVVLFFFKFGGKP